MSLSPDLQARVDASIGRWWHSIELPDGSHTSGYKTPEMLEQEWRGMHLPSLRGKSVVDIGAWDGYFSFRAEREGAAKVTAVDYYVWSFDPFEKINYENECRARGEQPRPYEEVPGLWRPDELPGKQSFDLAREVLDSKVESVVADFTAADLDTFPHADIVFFLGVLYHLRDLMPAFERLRAITGELAVIETEAIYLPSYPNVPMVEFLPGDSLHGDPTNFWSPNLPALIALARDAGFRKVETASGERLEGARRSHKRHTSATTPRGLLSRFSPPEPNLVYRYREVLHAWV
jgi:tRNA (mo5U34)-methyltransferase